MDILKSEISRKRQLVEERNLLVVRVLMVVGVEGQRVVYLCVGGCWGESI